MDALVHSPTHTIACTCVASNAHACVGAHVPLAACPQADRAALLHPSPCIMPPQLELHPWLVLPAERRLLQGVSGLGRFMVMAL